MENNKGYKIDFDFQSYHTPVSRAMFIAVFLGFVTAIVNLAFWSFYVTATHLGMSSYIINVQTIGFGSILPLVGFGAIYATLNHYLKKPGTLLTSILFALATLWLIVVIYKGDYGIDPDSIAKFKVLAITIVAIIGVSATIVFPICYNSKKMEDMIL